LHIWLEEGKSFNNYLIDSNTDTISEIGSVYSGEDLLTDENIHELLGDNYNFLEKETLETHLEVKMFSMVVRNSPKCLFWEPSDRYLINDSIDLKAFSEDHDLSPPLRNIFRIAGIKDITKRIELIEDDIEERSELKQILAVGITKHINNVWPEHDISIFIEIENMKCTVMVEDKDDPRPKYKMEQRSDGFKQFISILLNLSIESNVETIKNNIILLDEPEVHLHPSGIRDLRDEILKIAEGNIVFVSTHSIYLVDKLSLDRHYKVSKEKSLTSIKQIEKNNPYEEEVIYEALGTSVYEHIQPNMIVFEGKTDKDMFDVFSKKFKTVFQPVSIGSISADGVDKIPQYTKFIDGKFVKGYFVLYSDKDGKRIKKAILENSDTFTEANTFEINDLLETNKAATLEDLYPAEIIEDIILNKYQINLSLNNEPITKQLANYNKNNTKTINEKELKGFLVNAIIKDVGSSKMTKDKTKEKYSTYYSFVESLHKKLK
jgi:ABC-type multidrug transport system ATPase subunit